MAHVPADSVTAQDREAWLARFSRERAKIGRAHV